MTTTQRIVAGLLVADLALVAWILARGRRLRAEVAASRTWPAAPGRVVEVGVHAFGRVEYRQYDPVVTYEYEAGGRRFRSQRLYFGERMMFGSRARAERRLTAYPPGAALEVFHDPADPARAVVERSAPVLRRDLALLALLAALAVAIPFVPLAL